MDMTTDEVLERIKESEQKIRLACKWIDMNSAFFEKAIASDEIRNEIALLKENNINLYVCSEGDLLLFYYKYNEDTYKFTLNKF